MPCKQGPFLPQITRQKMIPGNKPRHSKGLSLGKTLLAHETGALRYGPPRVHLQSLTYLPDKGPCAQDPYSLQMKRQKAISGPKPSHTKDLSIGKTLFLNNICALRYGPPPTHSSNYLIRGHARKTLTLPRYIVRRSFRIKSQDIKR